MSRTPHYWVVHPFYDWQCKDCGMTASRKWLEDTAIDPKTKQAKKARPGCKGSDT